MKLEEIYMEHNYYNLHLEGDLNQQRRMVHNQIKVKHSFLNLSNLISGFIVIAVGTVMIGEVARVMRKQGIM
jgi:hypothetical protein